MIQANELRIGNVVLCDGCFLKIESITKDFTQGDISHIVSELRLYELKWTKSKNVPLADIYPIPLTDELLLRCGLDKVGLFYVSKDVPPRPFRFLLGKVEGYCYIEYRQRIVKIMYLHQLQNIYFALTGQELEINL